MSKIKTKESTLARMLAIVASAENGYDDEEKKAVENISAELEMNDLLKMTAEEFESVKGINGEELGVILKKAGEEVSEDEEAIVMEAVMRVALADGELAYTEMSNMIVVADALGMDHALLMLMLADAMKEAQNINVKFEE